MLVSVDSSSVRGSEQSITPSPLIFYTVPWAIPSCVNRWPTVPHEGKRDGTGIVTCGIAIRIRFCVNTPFVYQINAPCGLLGASCSAGYQECKDKKRHSPCCQDIQSTVLSMHAMHTVA